MLKIKSIFPLLKSENRRKIMREIKVVEFFDSSFKEWKPHTTVARVRDIKSNEIFNVYENQIRRFKLGDEISYFLVT
jgi:hypothetical protein